MPRSDGSPEKLLNDAHHVILKTVGKSRSFRLSSFNSSPEKRFNFEDDRLLTKSRTLPSNAGGDIALPVFPGPLLPTVRRLNSSPTHLGEASSSRCIVSEEKCDIVSPTGLASTDNQCNDEDVLTGKVEEKNVWGHTASTVAGNGISNAVNSLRIEFDSEVNATGDSIQSFAGDSNSNLSPTFDPKVNRDSNVFQGHTEWSKFVASRWSSKHRKFDHALSNTFEGNLHSSQSTRSLWKPRPRAESDQNEQLQMRPAKAQKIGTKYSEKMARVEPFSNSRDIARVYESDTMVPVQSTSVDAFASKTLRVGMGTKPQVSLSPLKISEDKTKYTHAGGQQTNVRRRRTFGSSIEHSEGLEGGRQMSDDWINEIRQPLSVAANSSKGNISALANSNSLPSKTSSSMQWNKSRCHIINIILLLILCFLSLLYSFAMRDHILFLENEIVKLQERLKGCSGIDYLKLAGKRDREWHLVESEFDINFQDYSDRNIRKFAFFVTIFLLLIPFLLCKYVDELPQLSGRFASRRAADEEVPLSKRVAYLVDVLFSTHPYVKPTALLLATMLLIGIGGVALYAVSSDSLWDALWRSWTYVADSGNHADSVGTQSRIVSVCISFGGMLIFALMLGLVSDAISEKVDSLRKGKSEVIESNHTLILGWSDKLGSLLKQLAIANQSLGGGVAVVLAERDKEEMELDIAKLEFDFMGTSVICRSGSPLILADLKKVSVSKARAIIVLAEVENADQSDARALRVVLCLTGVKEGLRGHIVVELSDIDNEALVKLVGGELVETVVAHDVIGRLMIQCARQPGLAQIWEDMLGFDNAEFYIKRWPQLDGMRFVDVLISFPEAIPCGLKVAAQGGKIVLNPADDCILCEGDEILVIAEDDDTYTPAPVPKVRRASLPKVVSPPKLPEKILFCGWRRDIDDMIQVLEAFLAPGSELWIFSEVPEIEREKKLIDGGLDPERLENTTLVHREGNPVIRRHLESLPLETFDSILILADEALEDSVVNADSRSLATLLLIRDIQSKRLPLRAGKVAQVCRPGYSQSSWIREMQQASDRSIIISEILDSRTKHLVSVSQISDYVLSNELVSMALAMVAEDKQINRVLEELFAEEGNELYIRPAEFYLYDQEELTFFEIMIRARQREEIVVGYRLDSAERFVINPSQKDVPQKWSLGDAFIVLAQEE